MYRSMWENQKVIFGGMLEKTCLTGKDVKTHVSKHLEIYYVGPVFFSKLPG